MRAFLVLIALSISCGGSDGGPVPREEFVRRFAEAICAYTFECCSAAEVMNTEEATCVRNVVESQSAFYRRYDEELAAGLMVYDEDRAGECIAGVKRASCSDVNRGAAVEACDFIFVGTTPDGEPCDRGNEERCESTKCNDEGRCQSLPGGGEPCASSGCAFGFVCLSSTCVALARNGGTCAEDRECESFKCEGGTCVVETRCDGDDTNDPPQLD